VWRVVLARSWVGLVLGWVDGTRGKGGGGGVSFLGCWVYGRVFGGRVPRGGGFLLGVFWFGGGGFGVVAGGACVALESWAGCLRFGSLGLG
jgi:hypothetical protein